MAVVSISMVEIVVGKSQRRDDIYCQWRGTKFGTACINIIIIFIQKKSSTSHRIASGVGHIIFIIWIGSELSEFGVYNFFISYWRSRDEHHLRSKG